MELDDILKEETPPEVPQTDEVAEAQARADSEGRAKHGERKTMAREKERAAQEAGKEPPPVKASAETPPVEVKPPEQEMTPKEKAAFTKAADEARKRQEKEQENAQLRAQIAALTQAQQRHAQQQEAPKPFLEDPEGHFNGFAQNVVQALAQTRQEIAGNRLATSEMIARSRHADFDEKMAAFKDIVAQAPQVWAQCSANVDPAEFAYTTAKNHMDLQAAGDIPTLRANLERELRIKWDQEQKDKQETVRKERAAIPPSLSDARGVRQNKVAWGGPTTLDSILSD